MVFDKQLSKKFRNSDYDLNNIFILKRSLRSLVFDCHYSNHVEGRKGS